jgi:hypothetical protein
MLVQSLTVRAQIKDRHFGQVSQTYSVNAPRGAQTRTQFSLSSGTSFRSKRSKKQSVRPNLRILNKFQFSKSRALQKPKTIPVHRPTHSKSAKNSSN